MFTIVVNNITVFSKLQTLMNEINKIFDSFKNEIIENVCQNVHSKSLMFNHSEKFVDRQLVEEYLYNIFLKQLRLKNCFQNNSKNHFENNSKNKFENGVNNDFYNCTLDKYTVEEIYDEYINYDKSIICDKINETSLSESIKNKLINRLNEVI